MNRKKLILLVTGLIVIILTGTILFFANAFFGNPVSAKIADYAVKQYVKDKYATLDLEVEKSRYNFKYEAYMARAKSQSNVDIHFAIYYSDGKVQRDDYDTYVLSMFNTIQRLSQEYSDYAKSLLAVELGYANITASVLYDKESLGPGDRNLQLGMKFDKSLPLYSEVVIGLTLPDNSLEGIARVFSDVHDVFKRNGCRFNKYGLFNETDGMLVMVNNVTPGDIESGELAKRLQEAKDNEGANGISLFIKGEKKSMGQSLVIIGAGVAGLTAGCYARMNGYRTTILEMAPTPGGLCTSWKRQGYLFDGSVAGLAGSAPGSPLYRLWEEIGVAKYCPLLYGENFGHIQLPDGRLITVYTNIDRLESHLLSMFPAEAGPIGELTGALRSVLDLEIPFSDAKGWEAVKEGLAAFLSAAAHLPVLLKYGTMTIRRFAEKFRDPALKMVFHNLVHFGGPDVPLLTVLLPLAYAHRKMAGIPLQGWLSFARAIERRFLELGGEIKYQSRVAKVILEKGEAKGVILADGASHRADRVLSAADGRFTQSVLIGKDGNEVSRLFKPEDISDQPVQVNLGVDQDFSAIDGPLTYLLEESGQAAGREHRRMTIHNKGYDPDAVPAGKSALTVFLDSDYFWWKGIASDPERYKAEKQRCAELVITVMERYYPGFKDRVEVVDVSTPLTRERYTGNMMGAMQARKAKANMIKVLLQGGPEYACKGIKGLYMAGQWVEPWGGITTAAQSGRKAIQVMCRDDGKEFTAFKA